MYLNNCRDKGWCARKALRSYSLVFLFLLFNQPLRLWLQNPQSNHRVKFTWVSDATATTKAWSGWKTNENKQVEECELLWAHRWWRRLIRTQKKKIDEGWKTSNEMENGFRKYTEEKGLQIWLSVYLWLNCDLIRRIRFEFPIFVAGFQSILYWNRICEVVVIHSNFCCYFIVC